MHVLMIQMQWCRCVLLCQVVPAGAGACVHVVLVLCCACVFVCDTIVDRAKWMCQLCTYMATQPFAYMVTQACRLAVAWRQQFHTGCVIDIVGYRRYVVYVDGAMCPQLMFLYSHSPNTHQAWTQ